MDKIVFGGGFSFVDLFAGCGGLSLGLLKSGWKGFFAVEKSPYAFTTFRHNLIDGNQIIFQDNSNFCDWPDWLEKREWEISDILGRHFDRLCDLRGKIRLLAGGPPCQGFSYAGKRSSTDERNQLFKKYIEFVEILDPAVVLIENVSGMNIPFPESKGGKSYAKKLYDALDQKYHVEQDVLQSSRFGVPQLRPRFITIGFHRQKNVITGSFFEELEKNRLPFLTSKGLSTSFPVSVEEAIGDIHRCYSTRICKDLESPKGLFREISYNERGIRSAYQRLMREHCPPDYQPNSLRLVNHHPGTIEKFRIVRESCRAGVSLSTTERKHLNEHMNIEIKKHSIVFLDKNKPAHTITTLPDDLVHFKQQRVHTVREYARFQSFPDWFEFKGKYTTGGPERKLEVPRYTQVGNAVPPLLAEVIGITIKKILDDSGWQH